MNLYEYQAKELFQEAAISIPPSGLVSIASMQDVRSKADTIGYPLLVKAQVLQGGRGKAGLIKFARSADQAVAIIGEFAAKNVKKVLLEQAVDIKRELYVSVTIDAPSGKAMIIVCAEGGIDIEELAETHPEKIIKETVNITQGLSPFLARDIAFRLHEPKGKEIAALLLKLFELFKKNDAELVEINPLFVTDSGDIVAGDGKLIIDDNSAFRQKKYIPGRDYYQSDAEYEAAKEGIPYLQFDGDISLMCAGAGLTTTVYDLIHYENGSVANYLEFGGPNYHKAQQAMELCLKNESKVILIVTFGTIARADVMAEGLVQAIKNLKPDRPIVACIRGTNEEDAVKTLKKAGLEPLFDTEEAVRKAVHLSKQVDL